MEKCIPNGNKNFSRALSPCDARYRNYVNVFHASDIRCLIYHFELHDCECGFVMQTLICSSRCTDINAIVCLRLTRIWRAFRVALRENMFAAHQQFPPAREVENIFVFKDENVALKCCSKWVRAHVEANHTFAHISRAYIESFSGKSLS